MGDCPVIQDNTHNNTLLHQWFRWLHIPYKNFLLSLPLWKNFVVAILSLADSTWLPKSSVHSADWSVDHFYDMPWKICLWHDVLVLQLLLPLGPPASGQQVYAQTGSRTVVWQKFCIQRSEYKFIICLRFVSDNKGPHQQSAGYKDWANTGKLSCSTVNTNT